MKKILLFLFATVAVSLSSRAAVYDRLTIDLNDETSVEVIMTDQMTLTFDDTNFIVSGVEKEVTIPKSNLKSISHVEKVIKDDNNPGGDENDPGDDENGDKNNGVGSIFDDVDFSNGLIFRNLPAGSRIIVADLSGKVELNVVVEGDYALPIDGFVPGTHIVNVNGKSYKFLVK